jgi:glycosyltransferase involved in cell wall biosynthesis
LTHADGINEKIYKQIESFKQAGIDVEMRANPRRTLLTLVHNLIPFFSKQYFNTDVDWQNQDFVYIRKGAVLDRSVLNLVKKVKLLNPKIKIILEMPTYPYIDEFPWFIKWDIWLKEKIATSKLKKYIDCIVTYSDDSEIFGIPCLNISNAYDFKQIPHYSENEEDAIHLIAVASLTFYHGYDRVIEGMKNYYQSGKASQEVKFTLIGDGPVLEGYRKLVEEYQLVDKISLVGRKKQSELAPYFNQADIGVDSLGRHRSGVVYNSSLKGKEYLAKGLPIVSGVKTDLDDRDFPYYLRVSADDTPLDISEIIKFYYDIMKNKTKQDLALEIFLYGKNNFSFDKTFKSVIDFVRE